MSPRRRTPHPAPPPARAVEIRAINGYQRGVSVYHDGRGSAQLAVYHVVEDEAFANDFHPIAGHMFRSVAWLTEAERIELARELVRGLLNVRLEVQP